MNPAYSARIRDIQLQVMNKADMVTVNGLFTIARLFHSVPARRPYHKMNT